jgi:hypothetical protein
MEWVLGMLSQWVKRFLGKRLSALFLVVLFVLAAGIGPVRSQLFTPARIDQVQLQKIYQAGNYYKACENLLNNLRIDPILCAPDKTLDKNQIQAIQNTVQTQIDPSQQTTVYSALGDVMGAIGKLESAESFLTSGLLLKDSLTIEANAAMHLSLGNTLRALGNLNRDRLAPPRYDYLPWKYEPSFMPEEDSEEYEIINNFYDRASREYETTRSITSTTQTVVDSNFLKKINVKVRLNALSLSLERGQDVDISSVDLNFLPNNNYDKINIRINFAKNMAYQLQKSSQPLDNK